MVNIATTPAAITAEALRKEREKEYGSYVAAEEIRIDGVLAFGKGYPVPVSHVEEYPQLLEADEEGNVPVVEATEENLAVLRGEAQPQADLEAPKPAASRTAWIDYARSQGAPESELTKTSEGGLGRNDLRDKYGESATADTGSTEA